MKVTLRAVAIVALALLVAPLGADGQQAGKVSRIGVLMFTPMTEASQGAFRQGLREHGYVEGQNILVEWRAADGRTDRAAALAAEFVRLKVDVIVATLTPAVQAAKDATSTIPIVMAPAGDPVGTGFVASLARPGGNITGVTGIGAELAGKQLELLREVIPSLTRVALLTHGGDPFAKSLVAETQTAAKTARIHLHVVAVRRAEEFEGAFSALRKEQAGAVIVQPSLLNTPAGQVAELAARHRLPSVSGPRHFAESGGLMAYGASLTDMQRRAASYVDKILKGAKPADIPVEQPTRFELVINLKTAKALGLTIPPSVLLRADQVIK